MTEPAQPPPFEVELHLGGGVVVPFKLWEHDLREHRNVQVKAMAIQHGAGREAARAAAIFLTEKAVTTNREKPIEVEDGDSYWIIPTGSVAAARFRDRTIKGERGAFGFSPDRLGSQTPPEHE